MIITIRPAAIKEKLKLTGNLIWNIGKKVVPWLLAYWWFFD